MFVIDTELFKKKLNKEEYDSIRPIVEQFNNFQSDPVLKKQFLQNFPNLKKNEAIYSLSCLYVDEKINLYFSRKVELTEDQHDFLKSILKYYENLASVWYAIELRNPLPWEKNKNWEGNKILKEGLEEHVKELQSLWNLIEYAEPLLIKEIQTKFPDIHDIHTLFYKIWCTQAFNSFKECLKPYIEISNSRIIDSLEVACKVSKNRSFKELKPHERKKIKIYEDLNDAENQYLALTCSICHKAAQAGDIVMQKLLDNYINNHESNLELCIRVRKRTRSTKNSKRCYCFRWCNGIREEYGIFKNNTHNS